MVEEASGSGERFRPPGGFSGTGKGGELQRGFWGLNRRKRRKLLLLESMGFKRGRGLLRGKRSPAMLTRGRRRSDRWVPVSAREGGKRVSVRELASWAILGTGPNRLPEVQFHFYFVYFFFFF
jgi:hypothetical protein